MTHAPVLGSAVPIPWMLVSTRVRDLAREWSKRLDISAAVKPRAGREGLAYYNPQDRTIHIDADVAFPGAEPEDIGDVRDRMELSRHPVAGGVILHESMHARLTSAVWDGDFVKRLGGRRVFEVFEMLEEMRVEHEGVALYPEDAGYLRASTRTLLMRDSEDELRSPRFAALCLYGRTVIGVLTVSDTMKVVNALYRAGWTPWHLDEVAKAIHAFSRLSDVGVDFEKQILIAQELDKVMPFDPPVDLGELGGDELFEAILDALARAERGGFSAVFEAAQDDKARKDAELEALAREIEAENKQAASDVFGQRQPQELRGARKPTGFEKAAAVTLARELEEAKYREKHVEEYTSAIPPGRLHGGEAMRKAAAEWAGGDTSGYKPFKKRKRFETEEPTLTVGIMCDTSGSMGALQPAVGVATWVISEAVYRMPEATAAQVYFGPGVWPGLRQGERLDEVRVWTGSGAREEFDEGFRALDGELDLLRGSGARLLFVISDGDFKGRQIAACENWLNTCTRNGVAVVWIKMSGQVLSNNPGVEVVDVDPDDILSAASAIGQACVRTLASVSG
ncbi:AAA-ATPase [Microbacterium phage Zooman]|nr:AAA-ATPase [Microbacterium phage Zooman]